MSLRAYARHRGCALNAVQQAIRAGRLSKSVKRDAEGGYSIDPKRADVEWEASTLSDRTPLTGPTAPARRPRAAASGAEAGDEPPGELPDLIEVRTRLEAAKAALTEMDLAERRGELVPANEVEAQIVGVFSSCKTKLLGVPARVRQLDPGLTKDQVGIIEGAIREALEGLAGAPRELEDQPA
jgi:hypothetical protein